MHTLYPLFHVGNEIGHPSNFLQWLNLFRREILFSALSSRPYISDKSRRFHADKISFSELDSPDECMSDGDVRP